MNDYLADMGISPRTVSFLRELGYGAVHLHEEGLDRLADPLILDKSLCEDRILLTHDLDFGELMAASGAHLPSVIIFRLRNMHPSHVNHHLHEVLRNHKIHLEQGVVVSVSEGQLRLRALPIDLDGSE